ncbi:MULTISPECIES: C39 family peptidase [unclassified Natrinema]|uniref:C39 family peptidase n=1 Tax=unclassified Natrinema TaxID=2622230 RepID=UPI00026D4A0D|nr:MULTISPECIES: C39 family peptidase [unclassified Natrinema]AFO59227.1 hypothetical protein NJ7G_4013 [Natrinema sp. J7-2]
MSKNEPWRSSRDRRSVLKGLGAVGATSVAAVTLSGTSTAASTQRGETAAIPESLARAVAKARVDYKSRHEHFAEFDPNGLADPELFYAAVDRNGAREYLPAAWVFPIETDGTEVGHIAIGAQPWLPPVIRCGTGVAPQHRAAELTIAGNSVERSDADTSRFVYKHPMLFGLELQSDGQRHPIFVDLYSGIATTVDDVPAAGPSRMETTQAEAQWQGIRQSRTRNETLSYSASSSESISGVPNWDGDVCSAGWIGCSPAAGSMVVRYHEDITGVDCDLMDELADEMGTDGKGRTKPWNIPDGIESHDSSYAAHNTYHGRRSEIMDEIDSGRPCIVSYWGDKASTVSAESGNVDLPDWVPELVGHSETVVGYEQDDNSWWDPTEPSLHVTTHDTYGDVNELTFTSTSVSFFITSIAP